MPIEDQRTRGFDTFRADPRFDLANIEADQTSDLEIRDPPFFDQTAHEPLADTKTIGKAIDFEETVLCAAIGTRTRQTWWE